MSRPLPTAVVGLLLAGCGQGPVAPAVALPNGRRVNGTALTVAVRHLCDATTQAHHDPGKAGSTFYLRSHSELHTLAAALGLTDRARSARLLEAMYAVEQDIAAVPARPGLATNLTALATRAGADLTSLHLPAPACTTRTRP